MKKSFAFVLVAFAGLASSATAANIGDIVAVDYTNNDVKLISGPGSVSTLLDLPGGNGSPDRLAGIVQGGNGKWYLTSGPVPIPNPSTSKIYEIDGLFSGAPSVSTWFNSDPVQNPSDIEYDADADSLFWIQNPFNNSQIAQGAQEGLYARNFSGGGVVQSFAEPAVNGATPRYEAGVNMSHDPLRAGRYYVTALNGGVLAGGPNPAADDVSPSTLWAFNLTPGTLAATPTLIGDMGAYGLTQMRGVTAVGNTLFITNFGINDGNGNGSLLRVDLDGTGTTILSVTTLLSGLNSPETIIYNPYTNKLVFDTGANLTNPKVYQVDLDGSNLLELASGFHVRDFQIVVPTPGAAGVAGLAALVALRRRRA